MIMPGYSNVQNEMWIFLKCRTVRIPFEASGGHPGAHPRLQTVRKIGEISQFKSSAAVWARRNVLRATAVID